MARDPSFLHRRLAAVIEGEPLILAGSSLGQFTGLIDHGGLVLGAVIVLPEHFEPAHRGSNFPVLHLKARTPNYLGLGAARFAETLSDETSFRIFLDEIDPGRTATVVSPFGIFPETLGGRRTWAPDAAKCRRLEAKLSQGAILDSILPWAEAEPAPRRASARWWNGARRRLGSKALVIQRTGHSSGGSQTYICNTRCDAARVLKHLDPDAGRVTPFIEGISYNVMGFVKAHGQVMVLPVSRQLSYRDGDGRGLYAGNLIGLEGDAEVFSKVRGDVEAAGNLLAGAGYSGPFGLDFIERADGAVVYHDLNPRVNGVISSLNMSAGPVMGALLTAPAWEFADLRILQDELAAAVVETPMARFSLVGTSTHPSGREPLVAGSCRIDSHLPAIGWLGPETGPEHVGGDTGVVQANFYGTRSPGGCTREVLGNLWCSPGTASELMGDLGASVVEKLIDSVACAGTPADLVAR